MRARLYIFSLLALFLAQCSGDHAMFDVLSQDGVITGDENLSETPGEPGGNSGTVTTNPVVGENSDASESSGSPVATGSAGESLGETAISTGVGDEDLGDAISPGEETGEAEVTAEVDAPGYDGPDSFEVDDDTDVAPSVDGDDDVDVDGPGYDDPGPFDGDDDDDVAPPSNPADSLTLDDDGDGLANAIDPRDSVADTWGFIDVDDLSVCVLENSAYTYHYVEGSKQTMQVQRLNQNNDAWLSDKTAPAPNTMSFEVLPNLNAFGIDVQNGINVTGLVNRNKAELPTVNCVDLASGEPAHEFEYGIYVKVQNLIRGTPSIYLAPTR